MPLQAESTAELCERARRACAKSREMVEEVKDIVAAAKAEVDATRRRLEDEDWPRR